MKIAMPLVNDFELTEMTACLDILRRAKINVETISLNNEDYVRASNGVEIKVDKSLKDISFNDYEMIILTGGMGTARYLDYKILSDALVEFNEKGKKLAAICAAPTILAKLNILKDKYATVYPGLEKDLEDNGAILSFYGVAQSSNVITATSMNFSIDFGLEIVEILLGQEKRNEIEKEIVRI